MIELEWYIPSKEKEKPMQNNDCKENVDPKKEERGHHRVLSNQNVANEKKVNPEEPNIQDVLNEMEMINEMKKLVN